MKYYQRTNILKSLSRNFWKADAKVEKDFITTKYFRHNFIKIIKYFLDGMDNIFIMS